MPPAVSRGGFVDEMGSTLCRGHDDPVVKVCESADFRVGRAVASWKIEGVDGVVPRRAQAACEPTRQLRVE
jgi:hypothetical protein